MMKRRTGMRSTALAALAMAVAAGCSSSHGPPGGDVEGTDSGGGAASEASSVLPDDAATRDATTGMSSSSSSGGSQDSGASEQDDASDGALRDAASRDGATAQEAGGATVLDQACSALCAAQSKLSCSMDVADCQSNCLTQAGDTENPGVSCESKYTAMAQCEAKLAASQWVCSETNVVPIPVQGQCTTTLCAWSCCVGSDFADPDIWAECMPECP
jgi:hypothetical protein